MRFQRLALLSTGSAYQSGFVRGIALKPVRSREAVRDTLVLGDNDRLAERPLIAGVCFS